MKTVKETKECPRLRRSARTKKVTPKTLSSGPVCLLCHQEPGDPEKLGDFLQKDSLCVHYFCLILSSKLPQKGQPNRGIHGFMPKDIRKEVSRASKKICFVCKKKGAAIKCQNNQCAKSFHLPCGQERGCLSQFFGEYKSFCGKHRPTQNIQQGSLGEESCVLCCEDLSKTSVENIRSPCCSQAIYHRKCIQKYAHTSAKHFFKCPQCNNREEFPREMLRMGIHIPDRDAAWELEPGAFLELYQRYKHCDAPICLYEQGRESFEDEGQWRLILCATCGSHGTHRECSSLRPNSKKWECSECSPASTMDYVSEDSADVPCCSSTFQTQEQFSRASNLEESPGSSWTEWIQPSLSEKPESSGGRRRRSWRSKGVRVTKNCKKSK
ncbi:PHD finger protein 7 isoform X1 [Arvicola amphibius]|uniref:PHD finger protein 7 isoform X1 n=1 Tax=Arvicola amphibius TaxID=1047088 RepID=UPI0018E35A8A|nr:PHD finger protein 7 isoform X1 [Arvicola amphibius]XP_038206008.1 PHD finger protein 7 isoform X1 [Arvicola amphibius]